MATLSEEDKKLFPAWAGVILLDSMTEICYTTIPRMGGGDPRSYIWTSFKKNYSPHGRG